MAGELEDRVDHSDCLLILEVIHWSCDTAEPASRRSDWKAIPKDINTHPNMRRHRPPVDDISHDVLRLLLRAYGRNDTNDVDDRFLSAVSTPHVAAIAVTQTDKVLHALHSHCKEVVVLVIHGHDDGWLGSAGTSHGGPDGG